MATEEQKKVEERRRRRIVRGGFASVMNDTKWRELFTLVERFRWPLRFRRKDIGGEEPEPGAWDIDLYHVMAGWKSIEWLEIDGREFIHQGQLLEPKIRDRTPEIKAMLTEARLPFSVEDDRVRVWGYLAPGASPNWVVAG